MTWGAFWVPPSAASPEAVAGPDLAVGVEPIDEQFAAKMRGVSWHEGCPVPMEDLRKVSVPYVDFQGQPQRGTLVVAATQAQAVGEAFLEAYRAGFQIERMDPVHHYEGDDARSMAANNTSAFNCRPVTGGQGWSAHALGLAIDVNPVQNPYVRDSRVLPEAGRAFLQRAEVRPGMLTAETSLTQAFKRQGWTWGGAWRSLKDYQHFSANGR